MLDASSAESRPRWIPRHTIFFVLLVLLLVMFFEVLRVGMIARNFSSAAGTSWGKVLSTFFFGIRFDLATTCYVVMPFIILGHLPWIGLRHSARHRRIVYRALVVVVMGLTFVLLAEFEFFREFQTRFNQLAFQYLNEPKTVVGMVWYNYPVVWYLLVCAVLTTGFALTLRLLMRRTLLATPGANERRFPAAEVGLMALLMGLMVVAMRGGLQGEPLNWGNAIVSDNDFVNQMTLNGLFALGEAGQDQLRHNRTSAWMRRMPIEEARVIARAMVVEPGEALLEPAERSVFRTGSTSANSITLQNRGRRPNVVLVIMESFSARFVGSCGSPQQRTPKFDELAAEGVLFNHAFSGGTHTHQGVFCTLLGFPNLPGYEYLMNSVVASQPFLSLPAIMKQEGYQSILLYNGNLAWDNMYGFFKKEGIERFIGTKEYPNPIKRDRVWGVTDQDVFDRANQEFEALDKTGPFFGVVLTLSNHAPFDLPEPVPFERTTDMGELNKRVDAIRYADWAVGRFMEQAKKLSYYDNTLFVFVGDHGFHVDPKLTETHLLYHHVPLLFHSPLLSKSNVVIDSTAGQVDIVPTILGLLGIQSPRAAWGRNLFSTNGREPFAVFKGSGGTGSDQAVALVRGDKLLVVGSSGETKLWRYVLNPEPRIEPFEDVGSQAQLQQMQRQLHGYIGAAMFELSKHRAGPITGELMHETPGP